MYEGGPGYKPEHSWNANTLLVSTDPVALDHTGWQMIERKRAEKGWKTLKAEERAPRYIATAADAEHRLGTNDPKQDFAHRGVRGKVETEIAAKRLNMLCKLDVEDAVNTPLADRSIAARS